MCWDWAEVCLTANSTASYIGKLKRLANVRTSKSTHIEKYAHRKVCTSKSTQIEKYANRKLCKSKSMHIEKYAHRKVCKSKSMQIENYAHRKVRTSKSTEIEKYANRKLCKSKSMYIEKYAHRKVCKSKITHIEKYAHRKVRKSKCTQNETVPLCSQRKFATHKNRVSASSCLSVCRNCKPPTPQSNLTLVRLSTVNRHITVAVHNGHFAGGPIRRMLRGQPIPHIWCPDRFEVSLTTLQTDTQMWQDQHTPWSVILTYLQEHSKHALTTHSYLQWHCPLLSGRTQAHYRNVLCAGQQSAPIYRLEAATVGGRLA